MRKGMFISIDGIDGAGKTTQVDVLHRYMNQHIGLTYAVSEPGGTKFTRQIRDILVAHDTDDHLVDLLLVNAARAYHYTHYIQPLLAQRVHILTDRYVHSSMAYQGHDVGVDVVTELHNIAAKGLMPDLTMILDVPVETAIDRMSQRTTKNRFDAAAVEVIAQRRAAFLAMANVVVIDGTGTFQDVFANIWKHVKEFHDEWQF